MTIVVISQQPPGGRCTLYARYAETIGTATGQSIKVLFSEQREAHGDGFPSLHLHGVAVQPADGVILAPQDIADFLASRLEAGQLAALTAQLDAVLDAFLGENAPD